MAITQETFLHAEEDAQALQDIINGPASGPGSVVTTRLGQVIYTVARAIQDIINRAADIDTALNNALTALNTANAAQAQAVEASTQAQAANAILTELATDNLLSPVEKATVIREYQHLVDEHSGLDAQAAAYGISQERINYDTSYNDLTNYLGILTTPVPWNNTTGNTIINSNFFTQYFNGVYSTRQTLLAKIYEKAKSFADQAANAASVAAAIATNAADVANQGLTLAGSKSAVFYQTTAPTNPQGGYPLRVGDIWFDTTTFVDSDSITKIKYDAYRWDGDSWEPAESTKLIIANEIAAGAIVASKIAAGAVTADKLTVGVGGGNLVRNSSFEDGVGTTHGWAVYDLAGVGAILSSFTDPGIHGSKVAKVAWTSGTPNRIGLYTYYSTMTVGGKAAGVQYRKNIWYVFACWALAGGTANGVGKVALRWNTDPDEIIPVAQPLLISTEYRRTIVKFRWTTNDPPSELFIDGHDGADVGTNGYFYFDGIQVAEGDVATSYAPRTDEILPDGVDAAMIVNGAIVADKIAANAITAGKIAAGEIKTSNYAESGGSPTAGAKLDHTGTALKVAPGNFQLGARFLSEFGTAAAMGQVTATGGTPSVTGLNLASASYWNAGLGANSGLEITFTNALKGTTPPVVMAIPLSVSTHANWSWGYVSGVGSAGAWTGVKLVAIDAPAAAGNAGWVNDLTAAWWGLEIICMDGWS
jgi:hypothetical protein